LDHFPSPFDALWYCTRSDLGAYRNNDKDSKGRKFIYQHVPIFRAIYVFMAKEAYSWEDAQRTTGLHELTLSDKVTNVKLGYFQLVSEINQFGRVIKNEFDCPLPEHYYRIRFFRNAVQEHWDRYFEHASGPDQSIFQKGKISVPYISGLRFAGNEQDVRKEVVERFKKYGSTLMITEEIEGKEYTDQIYSCLEKIHPELNSSPRNPDRKKFRDLADVLWKYNFPLPFYDVDKYISYLVKYLEEQLQNLGRSKEI